LKDRRRRKEKKEKDKKCITFSSVVKLVIANLLVIPEISALITASFRLYIKEGDKQARDSNCNSFFCVKEALGYLRPYSKLLTVIFRDKDRDRYKEFTK
jgi:hypothetical protein